MKAAPGAAPPLLAELRRVRMPYLHMACTLIDSGVEPRWISLPRLMYMALACGSLGGPLADAQSLGKPATQQEWGRVRWSGLNALTCGLLGTRLCSKSVCS